MGIHEAISELYRWALFLNWIRRQGKADPFHHAAVFDETFKVGEYIYVNHSGVANKPLLKPDQRQFWVCLVLEVRASDAQHVYLRVWWLYWPDELPSPSPGGRRAYHGKHELLMSNDMGIVDALTVAGRAKVTRWDEWQDDSDGEEGGVSLSGLYWRQWYNCVTQRISVS